MAWEDRNVRNPRWSMPDHGAINITYDSPRWGPNLEYSLLPNFGEEVMQELWDDCIAGKYGPIAEYDPNYVHS